MKKEDTADALDPVVKMIDNLAEKIKDKGNSPELNPAMIITFEDKAYKPLVLAFSTKEEVESLFKIAQVAGFSMAISTVSGLPKVQCVSLISLAEAYEVEVNGTEEGDASPYAVSVTAVSLFSDGSSRFNARNILRKWDEEKGIVSVVETIDEDDDAVAVADEVVVGEEHNSLPTEIFWKNYGIALATWNEADEELREKMDRSARNAFSSIIMPLFANDELVQHNNWS